MKRILSAAAVLTMLAAVGCSPSMVQPKDPGYSEVTNMSLASSAHAKDAPEGDGDTGEAVDVDAADAKAEAPAAADASADIKVDADAKADAPVWSAGDFVIYRFSGSFHKTQATLTEKVIARKGDSFTLEVTYDDGKTKDAIRAQMKGDSPMRADVVSVTRLVDGVEKPAKVAVYDELFARVALVADQNEAQLGSEKVKVDVAGHGAMTCERATYRVKVGKHTATMQTLASAAFVWGDIGAEITTASGKLIYKAEIVDAGHASPKAVAVASADDDY
jgi:hypothetical protein